MKTNEDKSTVPKEEKPDAAVTPKYKIVYRGYFEMADYTGGRYRIAVYSLNNWTFSHDYHLFLHD